MKNFFSFFKCITITLFIIVAGGCMGFRTYTPSDRNHTQGLETSALQELLDRSINDFSLPGLQAGILKPGQTPILASSGTIDLEHRLTPIDLHSSFRIGSTTKMFVSALICKMAEQKLLDLEDSLVLWFPDYPQASSIRIRNLLNQTSGIQESLFTDAWMMMISVLDPKKRWEPSEVISTLAKKAKPQTEEKRHFVYANDNYILLGLIAEKVGKKSLAAQLEQEFFIPLGMKDTCLLPWADRLPDGPVPGYDEFIPFGPHLISKDQTSWDSLTFASGAMSSSAHDLLIWLDAFFHGKIVSASSLDLMRTWTDAKENGRDNSIVGYGFGLAQYELSEIMLEGHPGGGFGGECFPFYDPSTDTSYVVVYNVSKKDNPAGKAILKELMRLK